MGAERGTGTAGSLLFYTNSGTALTEQMRINADGNVGIGLNNPTYKLHVNGKLKTNGIRESSDRRLKTGIVPIESALSLVKEMQGVTYRWKVDAFPEMGFDEELQYGLIAQELEEVVPELVGTDNEGWKSIEYSHIVPILIEAMKEQQREIEDLKNLQEQTADKLTFTAQNAANDKVELMNYIHALQKEVQILKGELTGVLDGPEGR